jgi:hypothetical protein
MRYPYLPGKSMEKRVFMLKEQISGCNVEQCNNEDNLESKSS